MQMHGLYINLKRKFIIQMKSKKKKQKKNKKQLTLNVRQRRIIRLFVIIINRKGDTVYVKLKFSKGATSH